MATERHPKHGEEGYEHADADVRSLYKFGAVLGILIIAVMWAMVHTYNFFAKHESLGPPASPFENQRELPPQPRLQPHPATDLKRYCEIEQEQLSTYGWVDQEQRAGSNSCGSRDGHRVAKGITGAACESGNSRNEHHARGIGYGTASDGDCGALRLSGAADERIG